MSNLKFIDKLQTYKQRGGELYKTYSDTYLDEQTDRSIGTKLQFTHIIAAIFWSLLFFIVFGVPQVFEMFNDFFLDRSFPYWSHIWLLIFSLNIYSFIKWNLYCSSNKSVDSPRNAISIMFLILPPLVLIILIFFYSIIDTGLNKYVHGKWLQEWLGLSMTVLSTVIYIAFVRLIWKSYSKDSEKNKRLHSIIYKTTSALAGIGLLYFGFATGIDGDSKHSIEIFNILLLFLMVWRQLIFYSRFLLIGLRDLMTYLIQQCLSIIPGIKLASSSKFTNQMAWSIISIVILFVIVFVTPFGYYQFKSTGISDKRIGIREHFESWIRNNDGRTEKNSNIYLIACQGGGSRAGYWTYEVLEQLENKFDNFYDNLFAISTVSGGTVGAATYLNTRDTLKWGNGIKNDSLRSKGVTEFFGSDYVSRSFFNYAFITPWGKYFGKKDRNHVLQDDMNERFEEIFSAYFPNSKITYNTVFPTITSANIKRPVFVANTYNITDKRKAVISSVKLGMKDTLWYDDIIESSKFVPKLPQAVNLSEMFPFLSGSAKMAYCGHSNMRRFYDGGVYENYGISTIKDIYEIITEIRERTQKYGERKIYIILITNTKDDDDYNKTSNKDDNGLTSLVKAVSNSTFNSWPEREYQSLRYHAEQKGDQVLEINLDESFNLNRWVSKSSMLKMDSLARSTVDTLTMGEGRIANPVEILDKDKGIRLYFNTGDEELRGNMASNLRLAYLDKFIKRSSYRYKITGYADHRGELEDNIRLAESRAKVFLDYIATIDSSIYDRASITKGIVLDSNIDAQYDSTEYQMARARRVELVRY